MRHKKAGLKLNRTSSHRSAMFRNMVTSLLKHERIRTTNAKAKELRRWAEHLITLGKRGDLHARRQALAIVQEKAVVHKLFDEVAKRYEKIAGGYTRVTKVGRRAGDAAPLSLIELIVPEKAVKKKKKTPAKKAKSKTPETPAETPESVEDKKAASKTTTAKKKTGKETDPEEKAPAKKKAKSEKTADETPKPKKTAKAKKDKQTEQPVEASEKGEKTADEPGAETKAPDVKAADLVPGSQSKSAAQDSASGTETAAESKSKTGAKAEKPADPETDQPDS